jgi:hypothetical protein
MATEKNISLILNKYNLSPLEVTRTLEIPVWASSLGPSLGPRSLGLAKDKDEGSSAKGGSSGSLASSSLASSASLASSGTKGGKGDTLASSASLAKGDKDEKDFECEKKWVQTTLIPDIEPEKRDFGMVCLKNVTDEEKVFF